ncbi:MAG TPA: CHASE3 domain-containing protein [Polyangiaceae bacterium]|nr:CHASE3 domain-containing protein [Polyangiaceae bacterium]
MNWTFGRKLALGFAVAMMTVAVIGFSGHRATAQLIEHNRSVDHTAQVRRALTQLLSALKDAETGQRGFLLTGDDRFLAPYQSGIGEAERWLGEARRLTADDPEQQARLGKLGPMIQDRFARLRKRIDERRSQGLEGVAQVNELLVGKEQMDRIREQFLEAENAESAVLAKRQAQAEQAAAFAQSTILWGSMLGTLLVVVAGLAIARSLSAQIGVAVRHIQTSAAELQAASNQQATGAKEQATAMNEVTTTISELLATSRQIAESARRVADIASETASQTRAGDATVARGTEAVSGIKRQVDAIVSNMLELGKKSQQIGSVLEIVSELAEQTNILAINATIEAAGAGDAGRRFGVVADEIRKLADRVGGSTKEIRGLIDDVRAAVNTTVMTTETGSKAVEAGSDQFGQVASSFRQISAQVTTTTEAAKEIELSTKQQATAVEQVNVAITNVAQASKESEVSTGQTLRTASELATLSRDLLRLVEAQRPSGVRRVPAEERG